MHIRGTYYYLLRGPVPTVFSNAPRVISLSTVKEGHVVKAAVTVRLQVKLVKLHLNHLVPKTSSGGQTHR